MDDPQSENKEHPDRLIHAITNYAEGQRGTRYALEGVEHTLDGGETASIVSVLRKGEADLTQDEAFARDDMSTPTDTERDGDLLRDYLDEATCTVNGIEVAGVAPSKELLEVATNKWDYYITLLSRQALPVAVFPVCQGEVRPAVSGYLTRRGEIGRFG